MFNFTFDPWMDLPPTGWFLFRRFLDTRVKSWSTSSSDEGRTGRDTSVSPNGRDTRHKSLLLPQAHHRRRVQERLDGHELSLPDHWSQWLVYSTQMSRSICLSSPFAKRWPHHKTNHISPPESSYSLTFISRKKRFKVFYIINIIKMSFLQNKNRYLFCKI